jgi:hypothetical protein
MPVARNGEMVLKYRERIDEYQEIVTKSNPILFRRPIFAAQKTFACGNRLFINLSHRRAHPLRIKLCPNLKSIKLETSFFNLLQSFKVCSSQWPIPNLRLGKFVQNLYD